ncbi:MAG: 4-(cytidine 5'-diphospho)-2-C-methyl-D-erythritol kinase [Bacteroidales bacterium]|nr:4-(cytidine 5'-diphospho)-2-C-methyl-D-erythritol kinase [Bacteroidales bacterium]MBR6540192.1 4-(cytidine 5'-diphospho)-2-C-methyl-D-erythritol kinase [Bacteroidales bacterium]
MILYPNAKINIGLNVIEKRVDGFHNLETLFYPVEAYDILEIVESDTLKMFQYGIDYPGEVMDNLCVRAYNLLKGEYNIPPVEIHLYKRIPVGAGLGGGSSDAAFTLKGLNDLFNLSIPDKKLWEYASMLGSDCPFFIYNKPMLGTGRGEILSEVEITDLSDYRIELVYPPYFVSTADAYRGIVPRNVRELNGEKFKGQSLVEMLKEPVESWKDNVTNDFEITVFNKIPELAKYKEDLYKRGAVYASMSGSGSAMFGVFKR